MKTEKVIHPSGIVGHRESFNDGDGVERYVTYYVTDPRTGHVFYHNESGPAIIRDNTEEYYFMGKYCSKKDFDELKHERFSLAIEQILKEK